MKSAVAVSPATPPSNRSAASSPRDLSEVRSGHSCYFHGCRKDTNCHCEICLASIHAIRDLIRSEASSLNQSFLTNLSVLKPKRAGPVPVPFLAESPPPTPEAAASTVTPPSMSQIRSPLRSRQAEKVISKKKHSWSLVLAIVGLLLLLWAADSGFLAAIMKEFGPKLTAEVVSRAGEESRALGSDLKRQLELLQQKVEGLVDAEISDCSSMDSTWAMNQLQGGQFLFHWRCVMHKTFAETLSIWGSPLRTAGLLSTGFSPRSMTILSGKITEWSDGKLLSTTRTSNSSSWTYEQWSSAALHLDANTWILEYERNGLFQGSAIISAAWEALRLQISNKTKKLRQLQKTQQHSARARRATPNLGRCNSSHSKCHTVSLMCDEMLGSTFS